MYKRLTIVTIVCLLLAITVSFAWMMEFAGNSGDLIEFNYEDSIYINPNDLDIDISIEINGSYVPVYSTKNEKNELVTFENAQPGDIFKYCVKIKNPTSNEIKTSILFSDITATEDDFYNNISLGIFSTKGFNAKYKAPKVDEFVISSRMEKDPAGNLITDGKHSVVFVEELIIPPDGDEVEIRFFVRFVSTRQNQNHLQNKKFTIGKINFMCI